jgi:hypothetical protein
MPALESPPGTAFRLLSHSRATHSATDNPQGQGPKTGLETHLSTDSPDCASAQIDNSLVRERFREQRNPWCGVVPGGRQ